MKNKEQNERLRKFNNGRGAILCNKCRVIIMQGFHPYGTITTEEWESDEPIYCEDCKGQVGNRQTTLA